MPPSHILVSKIVKIYIRLLVEFFIKLRRGRECFGYVPILTVPEHGC